MDLNTKIIRARTNLLLRHPFFGTLALRLKIELTDEVESASTDGLTLKFNPQYAEALPESQIEGTLAHLVLHLGLLHHTRRGTRDIKKWNRACDFAIEDIIASAGLAVPYNISNIAEFSGMSAEHIYSLLPDPQPDPEGGSGGGNSDDDGSGEAKGGDGDGDGDGDGGGGNNNEPPGVGDVEDYPGTSESQRKQTENEWKTAMSEAANAAKQAGKLPGTLERLVELSKDSQLPWTDIVSRFMTEPVNDEFTWNRGNRRFLANGMYLPSRYETTTGEVVIIVDTSGSLTSKQLDTFAVETQSIISEVRPSKTTVIYCDASINHVDEFLPDEDLKLQMYGGGGTNFKPPFDYIEKHGLEPKCVVYCTDGYASFNFEPPDRYPVLWCINNYDVVPPWGEHLVLDIQ